MINDSKIIVATTVGYVHCTLQNYAKYIDIGI